MPTPDTTRGMYSGMALPWGATLASYFEPKSDADILRTSIQMIIFTRIGERVMLYPFGSPIEEAVFEPGDSLLDSVLTDIVKQNVEAWDRRIEVLSVSVSTSESGNEKYIAVTYRDLSNPDREDQFTFSIPEGIVTSIAG